VTLELASDAFLSGYRRARLGRGVSEDIAKLVPDLQNLGLERLPFAVEGAAMALEAMDEERSNRDPTTRSLVDTFRSVVPDPWDPFVDLGVGCGLARRAAPLPEHATILDGYGFCVTLFGIASMQPEGEGESPFHRGVGRAVWFRTGGHAQASAALVARLGGLDEHWRGLGTACVFAGDPRNHASLLRDLAEGSMASVRDGAAEALRRWDSLGSLVPERVTRAFDLLSA
jgi:hypothetical protein